jgi:hypothetical protein
MLANRQVDTYDERGIDLPAAGRKHQLDGIKRPEHDATAPHRLDHLSIEQLGQG